MTLNGKGLVKKYGEQGRWAVAFGNVVDKKHIVHPLPLALMTDPPLKQG